MVIIATDGSAGGRARLLSLSAVLSGGFVVEIYRSLSQRPRAGEGGRAAHPRPAMPRSRARCMHEVMTTEPRRHAQSRHVRLRSAPPECVCQYGRIARSSRPAAPPTLRVPKSVNASAPYRRDSRPIRERVTTCRSTSRSTTLRLPLHRPSHSGRRSCACVRRRIRALDSRYSMRIEPTTHFINWQRTRSRTTWPRLVVPRPKFFRVQSPHRRDGGAQPFDYFSSRARSFPSTTNPRWDRARAFLLKLRRGRGSPSTCRARLGRAADHPLLMDLIHRLRHDVAYSSACSPAAEPE